MKIQFGLKFKLLGLASVPFLAFSIFAVLSVIQNLNDWTIGRKQAKNIHYLLENINLVSNLQKERDETFAYLRDGIGFDQIVSQRSRVDEAIQDYLEALSHSELPDLAKSTGSLVADRVPKLRTDIDAKNGTPEFFFSRACDIISGVLSITLIIADQPSLDGADRLITSLAILQKAQENMAQYRGSISRILMLKEALDNTTFITTIRQFQGVGSILNSPGLVLEQENKDALEKLQRGLEWRAVEAVLFDLSINKDTGNFSSDYDVFIKNSTLCIDGLKTVADLELELIAQKMSSLLKELIPRSYCCLRDF